MFEVFFYVHQLYIVYVVFYFFHVGVAYICMILPGIFLFLIDRYLRFLQSRRNARLLSTRLLPNGIMELTFAKNPGLSYTPTSILFVHVPSVCKFQWHPFTITSNSNLEPENLSIAIKTQGTWTHKLYTQLTSSDHLKVSTEGPYGPTSSHFLSRESLVMISGGSGITPFISIIRELISRSTESNTKVPKVLLITAFKNTNDLTMLDLLLPLTSTTTLDISKLQLQIQAYVTQEHERPTDREESKNQIETKLFKPNSLDSPISSVLGQNSWLWLGAIISSSFVMFLLLLGFVTRYQIYPVELRKENYHYSFKILWDMFLVCVSIFVTTSVVFLWQKRKTSSEGKQIQSVDLSNPTMSPASWLCGTERELESLPHQSLVQSTKVHFGARPDLKRILLDCKGSDVGVLVCGPKGMRHEVAKICASGQANNLFFESISFNWWEVKLDSAALLLGLVGNICFTFLFFPVTRGSSIFRLIGLTSESTIKYHVWLGHIVLTLFTAHGLCYVIFWAKTHQMIEMLKWDKVGISNVAGEVAFLSGLAMWLTSFRLVRRKQFELFFYTHHVYIVFVVFFVFHVGFSYSCIMLPGFYLFLIDRYLRFLQSQQRVRLISARVLPCQAIELNISKDPKLDYCTSSIMFINVKSISKLQWHPFTVISNSNLDPDRLSIVIKKEGYWTQKLYEKFSSPTPIDHLEVSVEGPYGHPSSSFLSIIALLVVQNQPFGTFGPIDLFCTLFSYDYRNFAA
ncbi:hypothetical protein RD792_000054 [Penstemon davidsonii]|uniref:FAD-binding FR-type domain-containing protein n=1 Tax=Penstemon davidsonii TaxID=160366 RepID=A0ABR0DU17_9LAMI|nr:hypothetical protein RD792_000054 [Penstemon davidsonii]